MKTRFAPSPTGFLHMGNIRTAMLCYLYARKAGGEFLLRLDDTDTERSTQEYADAIVKDLEWLGIAPDGIKKQSDRFDQYDAAVEKLKADGRLYPCYETQQELDIKRKMQMGRGLPPLYDREGLKLTEEKIAAFEAEGRKPHWRFKLDQETASSWDDEIRGKQHFEMRHMSDPILIRENGMYTYMLPSTVDDIEMGITHVLRGEDHVSNTAIQIQIFHALGGDLPTFAHNALIKSKDGKLSKRAGSSGMQELRDEGIEPLAVASFLAKLGTSDSVELKDSMETLVAEFDIKKFGKSQTMYTMEELERLNTKLLHTLPLAEVKDQLVAIGLNDVDETFWEVAKHNIESLDDVKDWWKMCKEQVEPAIDADDAEFIAASVDVLPDGEWSDETWGVWINAVKEQSGRKGKQLFMPVRKALTGMEHGPELKDLLPLIGREKVVARLQGQAA